jgi:4-amino-4-deoxy-L-arabinose transferase-like glycosyltransferase
MTETPAASSPSTRRIPRVVWIAIGVSVVIRLLYLLEIRHNPYFDYLVLDEAYHDQWAREIASNVFTHQIPFFRAPFYPFFLSLFYRIPGPTHFGLIRGVQLMIGATTPALVWAITRRLMPERPVAAVIAAFVTGLDGMLIHFEAELLLESVLAPMTCLLVLLTLRAGDTGGPRRWLAAGLVLGVYAITRPNVLLAAPLLFVLALGWKGADFALRRWRWRSGLALTIGTCLCIFPVTFVNWKIGGDRQLIASQGGLNFYFGNRPNAHGWEPGAPGIRPGWWDMLEDAKKIAERAEGRSLRPSEVSDYWYGQGMAWWREHPLDAMTHTTKKMVLLLSGLELPSNRDTGLFFREFAPPFLPFLYLFYIVAPLALVGAYSRWRRGTATRAVILYLAIYLVGIAMFFVNDRYRVPVRPLFEIFAVAGAIAIFDGLRTRSRRGAWPAAAAVVLGVALNVNPWVSENRFELLQFYDSAADIFQRKGRFAEAIEFQNKWIAALEGAHKNSKQAVRDLASIYLRADKPNEALEALQKARALDPGDPKTLELTATALSTTGRLDEAERMFAEAEAAGFDDPTILLDHAGVLEALQRPPAMIEAMYRRLVDKDPRFAQAWNQFGYYEARTGHLEEAVRAWNTAVQLAPDLPGLAEALDRAEHELAERATAPIDAGPSPSPDAGR